MQCDILQGLSGMFAAPGDRVKSAAHFGFLVGEKLIINLMFAHLQIGNKERCFVKFTN